MRHPLSYGKVMRPVSAVVRNRRWQARFLPDADYVNLGCGGNTFPGYVNVDWWRKPGVQLCWDMTLPLPIEPGSLAGVYSEHAVEHISLADARTLFGQVLGLLRPGGTFRLVVPDAGMYIDNYSRGMPDSDFCADGVTWMMEVNRVFRRNGHQYAWDWATARFELAKAGFSKIERCSFREGRDATLLIDSARRRDESLYVEASRAR